MIAMEIQTASIWCGQCSFQLDVTMNYSSGMNLMPLNHGDIQFFRMKQCVWCGTFNFFVQLPDWLLAMLAPMIGDKAAVKMQEGENR